MNVCLTGIVCFRCEYPERGGFVTYMKAEQMNVVLDHISKRFVRFFAWSLNIEFYISPCNNILGILEEEANQIK